MSFPKYQARKDSCVEWIGEVPRHWAVQPLKRHARLLTEKTDRRDQPVALENIESWTGRFLPTETEFEGDGVAFESGDVLFGKLRPYLAKTLVAESAGEAVGDFLVMRPAKTAESRFLAYQLRSREVVSIIDGSTFGSKMPRASWDFVGSMPAPLPPVGEQVSIVAFLDRETAKIDALVEEQRRLIELLKEKRQAVISRAVTKGLNPNVPMKDSGAQWLGKVPAHWDAVALKRISPAQTVGIVVNPSTYVASEGLPFLYGGDIREGRIDLTECRRISAKDSDKNAKTKLEAGDLVTVRVGAPGVTAVVPQEAEGGNCASVMLIRRGDFDSRWLCYVMNDRVVRFQVEIVQYGAAQEQFNISHAVEFIVPRPSRDEQTLIADHLDSQTAKLDELMAEAEAAMRLLAERRSALISAAVTGKIDVRGLVPQPEGAAA
jgi:type I restriction enzyme S subunit